MQRISFPQRSLPNPPYWRFLVLTIVVFGCWYEAAAQADAPCKKSPPGNWSVKTEQYKGPGSESTPYQIVSMTVEECNGYLYLTNLTMNGPKVRPFSTVELSIFVYRANDTSKPIAQDQVFRFGDGDGGYDEVGYWRTTAGRRWGAAFGAGSEPLMQAWIKDGVLEGDYTAAIGISLISFGSREVWRLDPAEDLRERSKALFTAAENEDLETLKNLISAGANVNTPDEWGMTPLIKAANYGRAKSVALLLSNGADVNAQSAQGFTALRLASQFGYAEAVKVLLKAHADFEIKDKDGESPLWASAFESRNETWKLLSAAGAAVESPTQALICAAGLGELDKVRKLIDDGVDVNAIGPKQTSAIQLSAINGHMDIVKLLLQNHADPNSADQWGWSSLGQSLFREHRDIAKELIAKGANVNSRDHYGATPLIVEAEVRNLENAKFLLEQGADPDLIDNDGKTALDYAVENANTGPVSENDPLVALLKTHTHQKKPDK
jgi:ankyrin repeat protein